MSYIRETRKDLAGPKPKALGMPKVSSDLEPARAFESAMDNHQKTRWSLASVRFGASESRIARSAATAQTTRDPLRGGSGQEANADLRSGLRRRTNRETGPQTEAISLEQAADRLREAQENRLRRIAANGPIRFRVPTTKDLKKLFTSGNVPKDVLKQRVEVALNRMAKEGRLKTADAIPDAMKKIFPADGTFNQAAYEEAVDVTDRTQVYQSVLDAETKVKSADKPALKTVMEDAANLIDQCVADDANLQSVFGTKKSKAKAVYQKAKVALKKAKDHMDASITTDYNLDDPETGLGGWATFSDQKVHFEASVVKVEDEDDAKTTIIHESSHLADESVDDKGYYDSPGFAAALEETKVTNAAHYEEIPRRKLGTSSFKNDDGTFKDFVPGASGGAPLTWEDKVRNKVDDHFRRAWDKAVDVAGFIRDARKAELAGSKHFFNTNKARILEVSRLMHLTIHEQPAATASVNQIDLVLAEGVARAMSTIQDSQAPSVPVPKIQDLHLPPIDPGSFGELDDEFGRPPRRGPGVPIRTDPRTERAAMNNAEDIAAGIVEENAIKSFGVLTGNDVDDKKLVDWLVSEYKKPL